MLMGGGCFRAICATNAPPTKRGGNPMKKHRIERNLLFPSKEFRDRVRSAASERGFRSEQAFILTACELELRQGDNTEARSEEHTSELQSLTNLVCRLLLEKKNKITNTNLSK